MRLVLLVNAQSSKGENVCVRWDIHGEEFSNTESAVSVGSPETPYLAALEKIVPASERLGGKRNKNILKIALVTSLSVSAFAAANSYHLLKTVVVAGAGGWDYLTVDDANRRLYISHEKQVDVLDVDSDAAVGKISNTLGVHGLAVARELNRGFTSNGRSSSVTMPAEVTLPT